jgi:hypothetical protein
MCAELIFNVQGMEDEGHNIVCWISKKNPTTNVMTLSQQDIIYTGWVVR